MTGNTKKNGAERIEWEVEGWRVETGGILLKMMKIKTADELNEFKEV